ncbi:MAG: preprotein translocase subunit SecD family protein, partial [Methermicoccaceae archaeon]
MLGRDSILRDSRVATLIISVLFALALINPVYHDGEFSSNLHYGLDLVGGSTLQLQVEGVIVGVNTTRDAVLIYEVENITGTTPVVINSAEDTLTLSLTTGMQSDELKRTLMLHGYRVDMSSSGNELVVTLHASEEGAVKTYLGWASSSEVTPFKEGKSTLYEIRSSISEDEVRAIVQPIGTLSSYRQGVTRQTLDLTKRVLDEKLNALGLKDIKVRTVGDQYILIDMAGEENLTHAEHIATSPGKFEVKFFIDGEYVPVLTGEQIESVGQVTFDNTRGWGTEFRVNREGADALRQTAIDYGVLDNPSAYPLVMFLDDKEIFNASLSPDLAESLRVQPVRDLVATTGMDSEAEQTARDLQVHLRVGALPVKVQLMGAGQVPAVLGKQFKQQSVVAGLLALLAVSFIVYLRYRQRKILVPMLLTSISEVVMILGFAALIKWELDLASIAGIIATIGTG